MEDSNETSQLIIDLSTYLSENINLFAIVGLGIIILILGLRKSGRNTKAKVTLKKMVKSNLHEPFTLHPEIDEARCLGCGDCTRVCPEGDVLQIINHKATLIKATKCVGHGLCEAACPVDAIDLVFGTKTRGMDIPRMTENYETNVPGLFIVGELGGMGLIRNAVKQGQMGAEYALTNLKKGSKADYDLLIVGAGPAGFAACLEATKQKKKYLCIEQNSLGGTVFNFPRQKIVMTIPMNLPLEGIVKFKKNVVSKEDLLEKWYEIQKKFDIKINEGTKFETVEGEDGLFKVKTSEGEVTAQKVLLAMGVRGSPRKLGLENEDGGKVAYNLIDPEQYQNQNIAIVGGGNAGVEAAQMLCDAKWNNTVTLLIREDKKNGLSRCAEDNQKLLFQCEDEGRIKILCFASTKEIHDKHIIIGIKDEDDVKLENDFLFVFAGALMPHKFLMDLGIEIDKKFGSKLGK